MKCLLSDNKGFTLVEVLVAIPLVVLLLSGIFNVLSVAVTSYQMSNGRMAVQQTARFAVDNIVRELQFVQGGAITLNSANEIEFVTNRNGVNETVIYSDAINNSDGTVQLMRNNVPITGDNITSVSISNLVFAPVNASNPTPTYPLTTNIVSITLTAEATNVINNPHYTVETTVATVR